MMWTDDPVRDAERYYSRPCPMCVCDDDSDYCEECSTIEQEEETWS